jgi:hypothetical protein
MRSRNTTRLGTAAGARPLARTVGDAIDTETSNDGFGNVAFRVLFGVAIDETVDASST